MSLPRNIVINLLSWALPIGATFLFTPIIVRGLGNERYGIYALIVGFINYSFYLSISRAIPVFLAEYRANNQPEKIAALVSATFAINLFVGSSAFLFFLIGAKWLVTSVMQISPQFQREAQIAFYMAGGTLLFLMVSQVFNSIPQALHRFDIYSSIALATTLLLQIGNVLLVVAGHNVSSLFIWNFILIILNCAAYWFVAKRLLPESRLTFAFSLGLVFKIIKYTGGVITYQIIGNMLFIFERTWLTRVSGHESLTFYAVPMTIALFIHTFISSLALVIFPLASEANAQNDKERLKTIYVRSIKVLTVLIVFPVVTLSVCRKEFLTVWMGADFAQHSATALALLTISFGMVALCVVTWSLVDGLGKPWFNALSVLSWIIVGVPLMVWLTPKMDVVGVAYGRFYSIVWTVPIYMLLIERWIFGKCLWAFWGRIIFFLGIIGTIAAFIQHFLLLNLSIGWLTLGFTVGLSGIIYCAGTWLAPYFSKEEKDWVFGLIRQRQKRIENSR